MTEREARQLAQAIVGRLLVNGAGDEAQRLVLTVDTPTHRDLGGWCRGAAEDQIVNLLESVSKRTLEDGR